MPTSALEVWPRFINLVERVPHRALLDVGPGHGKLAVLAREYLNNPPALIDAVEAWPDYVHEFELARLYDTVYVGDATTDRWETGYEYRRTAAGHLQLHDLPPVDARQRLAAYDVVVMGDVIEHMEKGPARRLVEGIPGAVVINTPVEFFHNGDGLPPTEAHVSHWGEDDWHDFGDRVDHVEVVHGAWLVRLRPL